MPRPALDSRPAPARVRETATTGSAASFLLDRDLDVQHDAVRIVAGFALVGAAVLAALNVVIWHDASQRIEREAWHRLEAATDVRRTDVDHALDVFRHEALSVAHDPALVASIGGSGPASDPAAREQLMNEL